MPNVDASPRTDSGRALRLHEQVALRPEPFGALAYHYGNRRLVFLKHPDIVRVVRSLGDHPTLGAAFEACEIAPRRWAAFEKAIESMIESDMIHIRSNDSGEPQ